MTSTLAKRLPALITSEQSPEWRSCAAITPNLLEAYKEALAGQFNIFRQKSDYDGRSNARLAQRIFETDPSQIVFLAHELRPYPLLKDLAALYGSRPIPPCEIHVFGDFDRFTPSWLEATPILRRTPVRFICASRRHKAFVSQFLDRFDRGIVICPFPVDTTVFRPNPALRKTVRAELGADVEEKICVYAGRISLQKNVIPLVHHFLEATDGLNFKSKLLIAGPFDDLGMSRFGVIPRKGTSLKSWRALIASLPRAQRNRVRYLGDLTQTELSGIYNAADLGLSLSVHHNEDFGMFAAEALCCGTRMLLSDWGGYASFADPHGYCQTIRTRPPKYGACLEDYISKNEVIRKIRSSLKSRVTELQREQIAKYFHGRYSISAVANKLSRLQAKPAIKFTGASDQMRKYILLWLLNQEHGSPMYSCQETLDGNYLDFYRHYFSSK